jgi:hypothetical protein
VRLHRSERVRGDRGADWSSHCSSSIPKSWRSYRDRLLGQRSPDGSVGARIRPRHLGSGTYSSRLVAGPQIWRHRSRCRARWALGRKAGYARECHRSGTAQIPRAPPRGCGCTCRDCEHVEIVIWRRPRIRRMRPSGGP